MPVTTQREIATTFRARRRLAIWLGGLPFVLGILIAFAGFGPYTFGLDTGTVFLIGFGIAGVSVVPMALIYRCPACGARIMGPGVCSGASFDFSADKCRRCGVSFVDS